MRQSWSSLLVLLLSCATVASSPASAKFSRSPATADRAAGLSLVPCRVPQPSDTKTTGDPGRNAKCGIFTVPENRQAEGRTLPLRVIVLPASSGKPREPVFVLGGGPGQAATELVSDYKEGEFADHDLVFMDVRGTGEGHALDCPGGSDERPEAYLEPFLAAGAGFAACRDALQRHADLMQYTTMAAMRDLDDLRQAMGYDKINIDSGSYGTRAALIYIHMFGGHVHAAVLNGSVPVENRAPLYHAAAAQRAFDLLVRQCADDAPCHAAYPHIGDDLRTVLRRLRTRPERVVIQHPVTRAPLQISLSASGFADALRVMLYSAEAGRRVPRLLQDARAGNLAPFAEAAMQSSRGLAKSIRTGLLLSFTCAEDVRRIRPEEVARATRGSFIGDQRVRSQMAACAVWPKPPVPQDYYAPVISNVPVLIISGEVDPVTPPAWGDLMLRSFPNGIHVVLPAGHTPYNDCTVALSTSFYAAGTAKGLDTGCVSALRYPPFILPG
ncbi:alpha/beta fold hydrolase [Sphingomonas alpina]|uniref:Alpha/beta fold hydrolase n=1 Tax=Sphingomonas alpina TaxID=653931 RepID=A0A7H0LKN8_9SPHN|nr:alpha/beta hydrolase [Sphingomonas alpina]QNQ10241.1 alpha/beta fold hydrolase [Sphingomonas alpina]